MNTETGTPPLEQIASLLIRQDMAAMDAGRGMDRTEDAEILLWAVATAGHRFDQHDLWDYSLLTDGQHVHRCFTHRHDGPLTRGFRL